MSNNNILKFEFTDKKLKIFSDQSSYEVEFPHKIDMVIQFGDKLVVLLLMDHIKFNENVFGVSAKGKILWQIKQKSYPHDFSPYTNISKEGNLVKAWNFSGSDLVIDPDTGKVICKSFEK